MTRPALFPDGHFYSPVVDVDEAYRDRERIWSEAGNLGGICMQDDLHRELLAEHFPRLLREYDYPLQGPEDEALSFYYEHNSQFRWMDSRSLFCLMRLIRPKRIIEVGSGYSSLLMSDVNERFLGGHVEISCVEPYPRPFLRTGAASGRFKLYEQRVQDLDTGVFSSLEPGDILFIDSSHVCKTGSDVTHLFLKILGVLAAGVYVHVHDIFLPNDYPTEWVLEDNRSWNEQYLLQALLAENPNYQVIFGSSYAFLRFPELVSAATKLPAFGGGSFWFRRCLPAMGSQTDMPKFHPAA